MPVDSSALAERFAIRELIDRYSYAVNERDWAALESCWAEDGVWDVGKPLNFKLEPIAMGSVPQIIVGSRRFLGAHAWRWKKSYKHT